MLSPQGRTCPHSPICTPIESCTALTAADSSPLHRQPLLTAEDIFGSEPDPARLKLTARVALRALLTPSMRHRDAPMRPQSIEVIESMTDAAHAERFAEAYGFDLRYDHRRDRWLHYSGHRWEPDRDGHIYRLAIEFARMRQMAAIAIPDAALKKQALAYFMKMESKAQIDRIVALAKVMPPVADVGDTWDLDPWLICTPNGVIDLNNGLLRAGDPADRITMSTAVPYDETATCPRWRQFVNEIFDDDQELVTFAQRYIGYALTGVTTEQVLAFFFGRGANGKGTFMNTIAYVLGDYAYNMPFSTIELRTRSAIPNDIAALEKRRFVIASETNDGTRLNEARIKALTGCDPITARFLHGEFFTFQPVAKFVLAVNHKPTVMDDSYGFWRRIRMVPFLRSFIGEQADQNLEALFHGDEAPGILRWAVEGCLAWRLNGGLTTPSAVLQATAEYADESDPLNDFLSACVEAERGGIVKASAIQLAYVKWADYARVDRRERLDAKALGKKLAEKLQKRHTNSGTVYDGIRLKTHDLFE